MNRKLRMTAALLLVVPGSIAAVLQGLHGLPLLVLAALAVPFNAPLVLAFHMGLRRAIKPLR